MSAIKSHRFDRAGRGPRSVASCDVLVEWAGPEWSGRPSWHPLSDFLTTTPLRRYAVGCPDLVALLPRGSLLVEDEEDDDDDDDED